MRGARLVGSPVARPFVSPPSLVASPRRRETTHTAVRAHGHQQASRTDACRGQMLSCSCSRVHSRSSARVCVRVRVGRSHSAARRSTAPSVIRRSVHVHRVQPCSASLVLRASFALGGGGDGGGRCGPIGETNGEARLRWPIRTFLNNHHTRAQTRHICCAI
jgi:hypothetical protein